ncbi:MAG: glycosyltransferase family 4 protein [Spirochaetaceae bacterium]|jgi:glycosyltransferase involved in cell wall biosynthesis|nr:glycosyltransferase family 4 protein [Spirochaetaceae bacterium]
MMKIGIDTFACNGGKSGVGVYLTQLLKRIPPSGDRYELFGWDFDRFAYSEVAPDMEFIPRCSVNGSTANSLWHIFKYQKFAEKRDYDGCFFPAAHRQLSSRSSIPSIGTVHDMGAYWGTRKTREHLGAILRVVLPNSLRKLDRIIAVSQFVKQELIELARVKESRIEVIPNGVDLKAFYPRPRNEESVVLIQPFSFRRPYILFVSRIDHPVKNHIRLIEAFGIFKERTRYPHRLVLAGDNRHGADKVKEAAANSVYKNDIFFTGYFPVQNLPALYAGADMVVIPSMYEGFGLGVLEAMASGVPVVCARAASLPEAAEHAALYFDPRSAEDMADRMVALSTNRDIYRECRALGLERVQAFSWDRCAERTLAIIQETVAQ